MDDESTALFKHSVNLYCSICMCVYMCVCSTVCVVCVWMEWVCVLQVENEAIINLNCT